MSFVHLHCHSPFSFLDGGSRLEDLVARAAELQMPALAITDHNNVCAAVQFSRLAREAGIKPIQGAEIELENGSHLTLLARNARGYASLCTLLTRAHFSHPRLQPRLAFEELAGLENCIVLSGCRQGEIAALILRGNYLAARRRAEEYLQLLGRDNFYIEMQDNLLPGNHLLNRRLLELADELKLEPAATNNVHYSNREDFIIHDLLCCVRSLSKIQEINPLRPLNAENYLKSGEEMAGLFAFCPRALQNSLHISEECEPVFKNNRLHFPRYELSGGDAAAKLRRLTLVGARQRYGGLNLQTMNRLEHELQVIIQMGYAGYFLLVHDLVGFARREGIRYAGRGSAADSLVAYCLYITEVDSLQRGLLFERFMSPERSELPDIDIDFEARYRDRVIDYVYKKYGAERVARVAAYNTFRARSALRDIGKALDLDENELDGIAKMMPPFAYADDMRGLMERLPELRESPLREERFRLLLDVCEKIAGFPRFLSTHLGGVVISDCPLQELTPLQYSALGPVICQFDKDDIEGLGLIKLDLLSLRTLTAVNDAARFIKQSGKNLDYDSIPLDDPETYEMISSGETIGIFQLESPAQRALQSRLGANQMEDIIASMALIRPGPIKGNMVEPYIARRQGKEPISFLHPRLQPILEKTYGVVLFQEQVIEIATAIAGFTPGEADQLRRVMTHARSGRIMDDIGRKFIHKAEQNGIDAETAAAIFACMAGYASYGFCEAHAAAFATTGFKTAYLLHHYPAEYYAAILNNQPMGFYPSHIICAEARRRGVIILPPDINHSQIDFSVEMGAIRVGLKQISGVSRVELDSIVKIRASRPFSSLRELVERTPLKIDSLENLIKCGTLDSLDSNRRFLLSCLPWLLQTRNQKQSGQGEMFSAMTLENYREIRDFTSAEKRYWEYRLMGIETGEHFMASLRTKLEKRRILSSRDLKNLPDKSAVTVSGLLLHPHRPPTRSGRITVFFSLEDEFGLSEVVMFEDVYMKYGAVIFGKQPGPLLVRGKLQRRGKGVSIVASYVGALRQTL
ncbi:DNA polymerase III subunit alpha [Syntrophomonas palmitatica]|uniref:DNA polymerase III subunit alpha n=1 Tax=Syntrophomonas palmitatica TaxID=402877 RepID=UPI0006D1785D|nr:DNA polymerase III subunit alpha [Syntrophomonas palmitatica]